MAEANGDPHTNPHGPHIPYHAGPDTAHEVGVMLGFMAVFMLSMTVYLLIWRIAFRRAERKELAEHAAITQQRKSAVAEQSPKIVINSETLRRWSWGGVQAF